MKRKWIKYLLFSLIGLVLVLPFMQQTTNIPRVKALTGYYHQYRKPSYQLENFMNGTFQDSLNKFIEQNIGFRPDLVRLNNQYKYSLFDTVSALGVIIGKEGYLFEYNYIKAYYGLDFVGMDTIQKHIDQTVFVNDWLEKNNKHLVVAFAPGKGSFFPEYIPDEYKTDSIFPKNEATYHRLLKENQIKVISGNEIFSSIKDTCRFALYPKCGIHWSFYGMGLVFDSILTTMEQQRGKPFVDFDTKSILVSHHLRVPDRDLWEGMNVFSKPNDYPMPYPDFSFTRTDPDNMPTVIVVADSYYWQWYSADYATKAFGKHDFWYYNNEIYPGDGGTSVQKRDIDVIARVLEADFIILLQTDATMTRYSFGFIPELYAAIKKVEGLDEAALMEIKNTMDRIRKSPSYLEMIREKATRRNISVDEMLRIDATWIYENKHAAPALDAKQEKK